MSYDEPDDDYSWVPEAKSSNPVEIAREVVEHGVRRSCDGVLIDAQSAHLMCQLADKLQPYSRAKLEAMAPARAFAVAWKLVR